jgi:hypothetical protein
MKVGDLVKLQNLNDEWGLVAIITNIVVLSNNTGTISLFSAGLGNCSIPWHKSDVYIKEVISCS